MSSDHPFTFQMTLLGAFMGGAFTLLAVGLTAWVTYLLWRKQHVIELAEVAARSVISHLLRARRCLTDYRAFTEAEDEVKAAVCEVGDLRPYEGLAGRVEYASAIIRDLANKRSRVKHLIVHEYKVPEDRQPVLNSYAIGRYAHRASSDIEKILESVEAARRNKKLPEWTPPTSEPTLEELGEDIKIKLRLLSDPQNQLSSNERNIINNVFEQIEGKDKSDGNDPVSPTAN
jgi:hypothetical protein